MCSMLSDFFDRVAVVELVSVVPSPLERVGGMRSGIVGSCIV